MKLGETEFTLKFEAEIERHTEMMAAGHGGYIYCQCPLARWIQENHERYCKERFLIKEGQRPLHEVLVALLNKYDLTYYLVAEMAGAESMELSTVFNCEAIAAEFAQEVLRRHAEGGESANKI